MVLSGWRLARVGLAVLAALSLSSCAGGGTVAMTAAPDAKNAGCADVTVRLPDSIGGPSDSAGGSADANEAALALRPTSAQATGAWGDPAAVLLWCGVAAPGPTTQACVEVNGVDWIIDDSAAPTYRFTTFGRQPTVTVVLDNTKVSGTTAITDLSAAVSVTKEVDHCLSLSDVPTAASG